MGRFSIRVQVFFLTGVFLAALAVTGASAWWAKTEIQAAAQRQAQAYENELALGRITRDLRRAEGHLMLFALGEESEWEPFVAKMADAVAALEGSDSLFSGDSVDEVVPRIAGLQDIADRLAALERNYDNTRSEALFGTFQSVKNVFLPATGEAVALIDALDQDLAQEALEARAAAAEVARRADMVIGAVFAAALALGLMLSWLAGRILAGPIIRMADNVRGLANKDFQTAISGTGRRDEIGQIAVSLEALRDQLSAADAAEAQARAENGRRVDLFRTLGTAMSRLRSGELSRRIKVSDWQELGESYVVLCKDFNALAEALEGLVGSVSASAAMVEKNAGELSGMSQEMSRRAEVQAATLEQSAAALEQLSESVQQAAERAKSVDEKVGAGRQRAEEGRVVMDQAMEAMSSIAKSSEQITRIIDVIDDIAFQTNLLALNAGVEAARAGESGKGFAVVASEVRGLAQRAAESANVIRNLVMNSTQQVEDGEVLVRRTGETLGQIVECVSDVSAMVSAIAGSALEQASGVREINTGVAELDKVTQQNAAMVNETTAASQQLSSEAMRLTELLRRFRGAVPEKAAPASADPGTAEQATSGPSHADLLHGSWAGEAACPDPEPVPMEPMRKASGQDGAWSDF